MFLIWFLHGPLISNTKFEESCSFRHELLSCRRANLMLAEHSYFRTGK